MNVRYTSPTNSNRGPLSSSMHFTIPNASDFSQDQQHEETDISPSKRSISCKYEQSDFVKRTSTSSSSTEPLFLVSNSPSQEDKKDNIKNDRPSSLPLFSPPSRKGESVIHVLSPRSSLSQPPQVESETANIPTLDTFHLTECIPTTSDVSQAQCQQLEECDLSPFTQTLTYKHEQSDFVKHTHSTESSLLLSQSPSVEDNKEQIRNGCLSSLPPLSPPPRKTDSSETVIHMLFPCSSTPSQPPQDESETANIPSLVPLLPHHDNDIPQLQLQPDPMKYLTGKYFLYWLLVLIYWYILCTLYFVYINRLLTQNTSIGTGGHKPM